MRRPPAFGTVPARLITATQACCDLKRRASDGAVPAGLVEYFLLDPALTCRAIECRRFATGVSNFWLASSRGVWFLDIRGEVILFCGRQKKSPTSRKGREKWGTLGWNGAGKTSIAGAIGWGNAFGIPSGAEARGIGGVDGPTEVGPFPGVLGGGGWGGGDIKVRVKNQN
jgi:hypothetical protein